MQVTLTPQASIKATQTEEKFSDALSEKITAVFGNVLLVPLVTFAEIWIGAYIISFIFGEDYFFFNSTVVVVISVATGLFFATLLYCIPVALYGYRRSTDEIVSYSFSNLASQILSKKEVYDNDAIHYLSKIKRAPSSLFEWVNVESKNSEQSYFSSLFKVEQGCVEDKKKHFIMYAKNDAELRNGTFKITKGAPWEDFANLMKVKINL